MYALNSTLDCFGQNVIEIQEAIVVELQKVFKWLKLNILSLNVAKSKLMFFINIMPQKVVPELSFTINDMVIDHVKEFTSLGLILDSNLNWKAHLNSISSQIARVIGLLRKLKYMYMLPKHILCSIYSSLILPHMNYSLLAWRSKCNIELLQKKVVRLINCNPAARFYFTVRGSHTNGAGLVILFQTASKNGGPLYKQGSLTRLPRNFKHY